MQETIPIDQAGRIVLPKRVREELAIKPGDYLKVSVQGSVVTLTPAGQTVGLIRKGKALVFSTAGSDAIDQQTIDAVTASVREESLHGIVHAVRNHQRGG